MQCYETNLKGAIPYHCIKHISRSVVKAEERTGLSIFLPYPASREMQARQITVLPRPV